MVYTVAADLVLALHAAFVIFAVAGGLLALRWPRMAGLHGPVLLWAAGVELFGWSCPLTPLEQELRRAAGEAGYAVGFLEQYLWPLLYPPGLTRGDQLVLGSGLLALNVAIYGLVWRRCRKRVRCIKA